MNFISTFVKRLVDAATPLPQYQIELPDSGINNDVEHYHQYGLKSIAPQDVETGICAHVNGQSDHTVILAFADDNAPKIDDGESVLYSKFGQKVHLKADGSIVLTNNGGAKISMAGNSIVLDSGSGAKITLSGGSISYDAASMMQNGTNIGKTHTHPQNNGNDNGGGVNTGAAQ